MAQAPAAAAPTPPDPNPGGLTITGNVDFPTVYVFRGIVQEADPSFTMFPSADFGWAFYSGEGGVKSVGVNLGSWHSLQTGSSGSGGVTEKIHYEEDFYTTLTVGFAKNLALATTYTAYTSPNAMFGTTHEILFKVSQSGKIAPYGIIAFEMQGGADGHDPGTYLELGAAPNFPLGKATLAIPAKFGFSLADYYQSPTTGEDNKFGFFDIGALVTVPIGPQTSKFGAWNIHGSVEFYAFGDTTKEFNVDKNGETSSGKVVALFGIGFTY
jgi:hypothetical protein